MDGGNIWNNIKSGIYNKLLSVFIDNNKGFASGIDTIFITTTGGESWSAEEIPINRSFNSIFFVNEYLGYVVGLNRAIYKTQSGGSNWFPQESGIFSVNSFNSVFFTDELNGYVVGTSGTYLKTTNGGDVWQSGYFGATSSLNDIFFLNEGDGYIVGDNGKIYKTTDMGNGWIEESSGTTNTLSCACFPNSNIGFIVGGNGTILKNENIVTSVKSSSGSFLTTSFKL